MALDQIRPRDIFKVIWKELRVGILLGLSVAVVCFAKLMLLDNLLLTGSENTYSLPDALAVALAIGLAVIVAKIVGGCIPLFAKAIHIDPAVFANPFITTITDIISLLILCGVTFTLFGFIL